MKKFLEILFLSLSITCGNVYGSYFGIDCDARFEDGFYGAISGGADWSMAYLGGVSSIYLIDDIHDTNAFSETWPLHGNTHDSVKGTGNIAIGYQLVDTRLYLGGQVSGTFTDRRKFKFERMSTFEHTAQEGYPPYSVVSGTSDTLTEVCMGCCELDLDLKPGFLIFKNLLLYGRVGALFTRMKIHSNAVWTETASENGLTLEASGFAQNSKNSVGYRLGAGMEYLINAHFGISLDYIYSDYGKARTRVEGHSTGFFDFNQVFGAHAPEIKIQTQSVLLGLIFHL